MPLAIRFWLRGGWGRRWRRRRGRRRAVHVQVRFFGVVVPPHRVVVRFRHFVFPCGSCIRRGGKRLFVFAEYGDAKQVLWVGIKLPRGLENRGQFCLRTESAPSANKRGRGRGVCLLLVFNQRDEPRPNFCKAVHNYRFGNAPARIFDAVHGGLPRTSPRFVQTRQTRARPVWRASFRGA